MEQDNANALPSEAPQPMGVDEKLENLKNVIIDLNESFSERMDKALDFSHMVKGLNLELEQYKKDYHFSIVKPLVFDIMDMRDDLLTRQKSYSEKKDSEILVVLGVLIRKIEITLERYSIFPIAVGEGKQFDPTRQKAIEMVDLVKGAVPNTVAETISSGYYMSKEGKKSIVRAETVKVYRG